ncbi:Rhodanese domain-containing protein [Lachancea thermotolerans]|uniref:KLTH0D12870p n=1 Tax=Lachancea thermotolerans (strain ATCC 56472 / CBS 6340 / NRRL Y-8284) TaxID=559295 RepID=C5DF78_LACTC|nr:KLTH0D12870p [Lachancea thermotolerans CBS 6340]CAR22833.1 KLTH0D12870p [Lachancea thermotolerans CBS 6340]
MLRALLVAPRCAVGSRCMSTSASKVYKFEDIRSLVQKPNPQKILVDVREPSELQQYKLPTAINIPLKSAPGALGLSPDEFQDVFDFEKPKTDKELIFFCAAGVRAKAAEELAKSYGYENTGVYPGSIHEWLERGGDKL